MLAILLVTRGIGFEIVDDRAVQNQLPAIPDFVREPPFNNMWLMVVLIWIQTGFAMVIFSSAIKAVPTELIEAASIDGATRVQMFWRVTLPQIAADDRRRRHDADRHGDEGLRHHPGDDRRPDRHPGDRQPDDRADQLRATSASASTFATLLFVGVLPVMIYNIRSMQKAKLTMTATIVDPSRAGGPAVPLPAIDPDVGALAARRRVADADDRPARQLVPRARPSSSVRDGGTCCSGTATGFTLENYRTVLADATGNVPTIRSGLANSLAIALPATIIPIGIAAFAAYAFAWIDFRGRQPLFIATVSLLAIPLQVALVPLLRLFNFGAHLTIPWLDKTITVFPDLGI